MAIEDKRDFREETFLNAAEFQMLKNVAGTYGMSKAAALRYCLHVVGEKFTREERRRSTGEVPEL